MSLLCLQETKLEVFDPHVMYCLLGSNFDYHYLPASNTRGGIILAWCTDTWSVTNAHNTQYTITAHVKNQVTNLGWCIMTVYGPHTEQQKMEFLEELGHIRQRRAAAWLLCGDFNMIYRAADKNNTILHRQLMGRFCRFFNMYELKELPLQGRRFTWSNEQHRPTAYPNNLLRSLSSGCSDHAPLILRTDALTYLRRRFHFEKIWIKYPGFLDVVRGAWPYPHRNMNAF